MRCTVGDVDNGLKSPLIFDPANDWLDSTGDIGSGCGVVEVDLRHGEENELLHSDDSRSCVWPTSTGRGPAIEIEAEVGMRSATSGVVHLSSGKMTSLPIASA